MNCDMKLLRDYDIRLFFSLEKYLLHRKREGRKKKWSTLTSTFFPQMRNVYVTTGNWVTSCYAALSLATKKCTKPNKMRNWIYEISAMLREVTSNWQEGESLSRRRPAKACQIKQDSLGKWEHVSMLSDVLSFNKKINWPHLSAGQDLEIT